MGFQIAFGSFCFFVLGVVSTWSWEVSNFHWMKSDNDEPLCAMSPPNKTLNAIALTGLCTASCLHVQPSPCHVVNYRKNAKLCQQFYYIPSSYDVQSDCVSYKVTIIVFVS